MKRNVLLSTLWVFLVFNLIFCLVYTLNYAANLNGKADGILLPQELLPAFSIMLEVAMAMVLLTRILKRKLNRMLNIIFGAAIAVLQLWGLTNGGPTFIYYFINIVEIVTCISIIILAIKWKQE